MHVSSRVIKNVAVIVTAGFILSACTSSPSPVLPPVDLPDIKQSLQIDSGWIQRIGVGASDSYLHLQPAIEGKTGFAVDKNGYLCSFDIVTGKKLWEKQLHEPLATGPSLQNGQLYLGTTEGDVLALNPADGNLIWKVAVSSEVIAAPVGSRNVVVVRSVDGRLYGLDKRTGRRIWVFERSVPVLTLRGNSQPVIVNEMVISGLDNGRLVALTLAEGNLLWEAIVSVPQGRSEIERLVDIDATPVVQDDVVYSVTYQGRVAALRLDSGRILWSRDISSYSGMQTDAYRIYISDAAGVIWALDRTTGATLWKQDKLLRRSLSRPSLQGRYLVIGDFNGYLHWVNRSDGKLMARMRMKRNSFEYKNEKEDDREFSKTRNILVAPIVRDKHLYAIDRRGVLSSFQLVSDN